MVGLRGVFEVADVVVFEVDLHPDHACGGPLDLHLAIDVDPRSLAFRDVVPTGEGRPRVVADVVLPDGSGVDTVTLELVDDARNRLIEGIIAARKVFAP